jgi:hypothetical protein
MFLSNFLFLLVNYFQYLRLLLGCYNLLLLILLRVWILFDFFISNRIDLRLLLLLSYFLLVLLFVWLLLILVNSIIILAIHLIQLLLYILDLDLHNIDILFLISTQLREVGCSHKVFEYYWVIFWEKSFSIK